MDTLKDMLARERHKVASMTVLPQGFSMTIVPQPWIPVSERLPEDGQSVIVFWSKYKEVGEAVFGKEEGWFSTDRDGCYDVSHWMPLPEPPEAE